MTKEEFLAKNGETYMISKHKVAWETILPDEEIKAYYRKRRKLLMDGTPLEEYYVLTNQYLVDVTVKGDQVKSKTQKFTPIYIIKDFNYGTEDQGQDLQSCKIDVELQNGQAPLSFKEPELEEDRKDYFAFINALN